MREDGSVTLNMEGFYISNSPFTGQENNVDGRSDERQGEGPKDQG